MKKYFKPQTEIIEVSTTSSILAGSVTGGDIYDIGYGGTDNEGSLDPQSRRNINVWGRW